jgi:hypothetical protein
MFYDALQKLFVVAYTLMGESNNCTTKTNMGKKWYHLTAYDRWIFLKNIKGLRSFKSVNVFTVLRDTLL